MPNTQKCEICGNFVKILFPCSRCGKDVCRRCFLVQAGLCVDCEAVFYPEKYAEKIEAYARGDAILI